MSVQRFIVSKRVSDPSNKLMTYINAFGGNVSLIGGYKIHEFTSASSTFFVEFSPNNILSMVEYLIVAGGASGAQDKGGGGGAGGLLSGSISVVNSSYPIVVGTGGIKPDGSGASGGVGYMGTIPGNSSALGLLAIGGGRAGGDYSTGSQTGGSSGGAFNGGAVASATSGQGNIGGAGNNSTTNGGGGGGAGAPGTAAASGAGGGNGLQISVSGTAKYYAGGGAGNDINNTLRSGGLGGGGSASTTAALRAGENNTGGGGAGGYGGWGSAGNGGSGIVIIRYLYS